MNRQTKNNLTYILYGVGAYIAYNLYTKGSIGLGEDYYGPPRPGQSYTQYNSFMNMPIAVGASGAVIGALVAGPIGAVVGGVGSWLMSGGPKHSSKPTTQGG